MFKRIREFFASVFSKDENPPITRSAVAVVLVSAVLMMVGLIFMPRPGEKADVSKGVHLKNNIYARKDFTKVDRKKSAEVEENLRAELPHVYEIDIRRGLKTLDDLENAFLRYVDGTNRSKRNSGDNPILQELQSQDKDWQSEFRTIINDLHTTGQLKRYFNSWRNSIRHGVFADDVEYDKAPIRQIIVYQGSSFERAPEDHSGFDRKSELVSRMVQNISQDNARIRSTLKKIFTGQIAPNLRYDAEKTEKLLADAAKDRQVYHIVHRGQILFKAGQKISESDVTLFQDYQQSLNQNEYSLSNILKFVQQCVLMIVLMVLLTVFIRKNHPDALTRTGSISLFSGVILLSLLMNRLFAWIFLSVSHSWNLPHSLFYLALPLAMPALLIATLFGLRTAIYVGIFTSVATAAALGNSYPAFITGLMLCGFGALAVHKVFDYKKFFIRTIVVTTLITLFSSLIFLNEYLFQNVSSENQWHVIFVGLVAMPLFSGFSTALSALLILFFLESIFHVASNMSYLTFTDRNHKLLKDLSTNAPGTYQHCDRVALLGEKAAAEVGLDPIKVQACALFHDVGKLKYPTMFTENNASGENRLKGMPPQECVKHIKEHVTYGQELAKEYKLPYLLRRAIESHHGTDFISFFYMQAKEQGIPDLNEADFRYDGPLPREKEVALVGLADCCEAAVQSIANPTPEKISNMVESLFDKKIRSGQLDETGFSLNDINRIKRSFIETLMAAHNKRIAYPSNQKMEGNNS